jgi:hypothetical protein
MYFLLSCFKNVFKKKRSDKIHVEYESLQRERLRNEHLHIDNNYRYGYYTADGKGYN